MELTPEDWMWWLEKNDTDEDREQIAHVVCSAFKDLINESARDRRNELGAMRSMYLDIFDERFGSETIAFSRPMRSPYNLLQGAVDASLAHIVTQRPRPMVLSIGGSGPLRRLARKRQLWLDGEYHRLKVYKLLRGMVLDSLLYGTGCLKICSHNGRNKLERTWCGDLWTDPREERFSAVRTLYQLYAIDREVLKRRFKKYEKQIDNVKEMVVDDVPFPDLKTYGYQTPNLINVIEAWRLPIDDQTPGKRVLVIDGATLEVEDWTDPDFPFVRFLWAEKSMSWWGQGMVERGAGMQSDLNELCDIIRETYETFVPQYWAKEGSTNTESISDMIGKINKYTGDKKPEMDSPSINPVILEQEQRMAERFMQVLGIDPTRGQGSQPKNVDSAKGIQVLLDGSTTRYVPNEQQYEEVVAVELADKLIRNAHRLAKGKKQRVYAGQYMRGGMQAIEFSDTVPAGGTEDEVFFIRPYPVANLSNSVSQRYDDIERMEQNGAFPDQRMKREAMAVPDLDGYVDRDLAGSDLIEIAIEKALEGKDVAPDSYWPMPEASIRIAQTIQLAQVNGEDAKGIQKLRNLHQALLQMPVNPLTQLTTTPNDPALVPNPMVVNPSPAVPTGVPGASPMGPPGMAGPPMGGPVPPGMPPQGPIQ